MDDPTLFIIVLAAFALTMRPRRIPTMRVLGRQSYRTETGGWRWTQGKLYPRSSSLQFGRGLPERVAATRAFPHYYNRLY